MARPKDPKTERIHVRLSPEEHSELMEAAKREAMTLPEYLRMSGLKRRPPSTLLDRDAQREIWKQVSGIARNINQITIRANQLIFVPGELENIQREVQNLTLALLECAGKKIK